MIIVFGIITVIVFFLFFNKKPDSSEDGFCNSLDCVRCSPKFSNIKSKCENEYGIKLKKGQIWKEPDLPELPAYPELETILSPEIIQNLQKSIPIFKQEFKNSIKLQNDLESPWQKTFILNQGTWTGNCLNTKSTLQKILNPHNLLLENNIFGNILFSTITDKISPHYGPTNLRLRLQICLEVNNNFEMICDNHKKKWTKNCMFLLNDWLLHEVVKINPKVSSKRSVLIIDLNRKHENMQFYA